MSYRRFSRKFELPFDSHPEGPTYVSKEFPFKKIYVSDDVLRRRMEALREYKPNFISRPYTLTNIPSLQPHELMFIDEGTGSLVPVTLLHSDDDYEKFSNIADIFTEPVRVRARRKEAELSPLEFWIRTRPLILDKARDEAKTLGRKMDALLIREVIRSMVPEVTNFRPTNMVAIARLFTPKRVLDFSSGWGDRLVAALALNLDRYVGVDPNSALFKGYDDIIRFFEPVESTSVEGVNTTYNLENERSVTLINAPFETLDMTTEQFDMVFTSPPYFDLEVYTSSKDQSISRYVTVDRWYIDFLLLSITKAWHHLEIGGVLVLVINDPPSGLRTRYTQQMIRDVCAFSDSRYLGVISYATSTKDKIQNHQPMWIWRKVPLLRVNSEIQLDRSEFTYGDLVFLDSADLSIAMEAKNHGVRSVLSALKLPSDAGDFLSLGSHIKIGDPLKAERLKALIPERVVHYTH